MGACLDRDIELIDVGLAEVAETLEALTPQVLDQGLLGKQFTIFHRVKTIFSKAPVRSLDEFFSKLLSNFIEIGARHDAKVNPFSSHLCKSVAHLLSDSGSGDGECLINIKEC